MLTTFIFAIVQCYKYRVSLRNFLVNRNCYNNSKSILSVALDPIKLNDTANHVPVTINQSASIDPAETIIKDFCIDQITTIKLDSLKNDFVALILDYDGVLSCQGEKQPLPQVIQWLEQAVRIFGSKKIFILSNNPTIARQAFINQQFNEQIVFIIPEQPKPHIEGIDKVFATLQLDHQLNQPIDKSKILLVDDRLLTGILAAKIFGITGCLITKPYINIRDRCIVESWFILVRKLERFMVWHL